MRDNQKRIDEYLVIVQSCEMSGDDVYANIGLADSSNVAYRKIVVGPDEAVRYPYLTERRRKSTAHAIFDAFLKARLQEIVAFVHSLCRTEK